MEYLFVYGTLRPYHENAHLLERIGGTWLKGSVHGTVHILDWGPDQGLFALVLDAEAPAVEGYFFCSEHLATHWAMLDEFEGMQYQRVKVQGMTVSGERINAWTYEMNQQANSRAESGV